MERICLEIVLFTIVFSSMCWLVSDSGESVGIAPIVEVVEIEDELIVEDEVSEDLAGLKISSISLGLDLVNSRMLEIFGEGWNLSKRGKLLRGQHLLTKIEKLVMGLAEDEGQVLMMELEKLMGAGTGLVA